MTFRRQPRCVRMARSDREAAQRALERAGTKLEGVHDIQGTRC
jgi:hypothetical protein